MTKSNEKIEIFNKFCTVVVGLTMFMEAIDSSVLNTAIPAMAQSLSTNPVDLKLALISYLLSLAIFIPISGWIADKYDTKKVFMSALIVFTLSSIACANTHTLLGIIFTRAIQGIGGAFTLPLGRFIIIRTSKRHELIAKMTIVVMIASAGMLLGPLVGGVITHYLSWRWIFWINAPIGFFILLLANKVLPQFPKQHHVHPLDKIGFILFGCGLAILTLGLALISESNLNLIIPISLLGIALILLTTYYHWSKHQKYPILNTTLLKIRTFLIAILGNLACRISFGGTPFLLPLTLQIGLGYEPQISGLLLAPMAIGVFIIKPFAIHILRKFGYKHVLIFNTCLIALSLALFASIQPTTPPMIIGMFSFLHGVFIALQFTAMNSLAYAEVDETHQSNATSIMSTVQQLTISFGVAIAAIGIKIFAHFSASTTLTLAILQHTFLFISGATAISGLIFMTLKQTDGQSLIRAPA